MKLYGVKKAIVLSIGLLFISACSTDDPAKQVDYKEYFNGKSPTQYYSQFITGETVLSKTHSHVLTLRGVQEVGRYNEKSTPKLITGTIDIRIIMYADDSFRVIYYPEAKLNLPMEPTNSFWKIEGDRLLLPGVGYGLPAKAPKGEEAVRIYFEQTREDLPQQSALFTYRNSRFDNRVAEYRPFYKSRIRKLTCKEVDCGLLTFHTEEGGTVQMVRVGNDKGFVAYVLRKTLLSHLDGAVALATKSFQNPSEDFKSEEGVPSIVFIKYCEHVGGEHEVLKSVTKDKIGFCKFTDGSIIDSQALGLGPKNYEELDKVLKRN